MTFNPRGPRFALLAFLAPLLAHPAAAQWTDAGTYIYATDAPNVAITDTGRVGIGTTNPLSPLHVTGDLRLELGEGLLFYSNPDFWGTGQDSRNIRLIDGNSSQANVDGGLVIETYTTSDNFRLPLMTLRHNAANQTYFGFGALYPEHLFSLHSTWTLGNGRVDVSGTDVYGTGTSFLSTIEAGSEVLIGGAVRRVAEVLSDTQLEVERSFLATSTQAYHRYNRPLFWITEEGKATLGTDFGGAELDVYGPLKIGGNEVIDAGGNWTGPSSWVDLTSSQFIDGSKTFDDLIVAENGLNSLSDIQIGTSGAGRRLNIFTGAEAINFYGNGGSRYAYVATNANRDFILHAPLAGSRVRIGGEVHLRALDTSSYQSLYAARLIANSGLDLTDSAGNTKGELRVSGSDTVFEGLTGSTLRVAADLRAQKDLIVDGTLEVENRIEITGGDLIFHPLPEGVPIGQVCYGNLGGSTEILIKCSSSERFKEDVVPLESGMSIVEKLRPVSYAWKENGQRDLGFVAEEVAQVEPLLAAISNGVVDGVRYDKMTAVLVDALQEQQAEIRRQREQIEDLRALLCLDRKDASVCNE